MTRRGFWMTKNPPARSSSRYKGKCRSWFFFFQRLSLTWFGHFFSCHSFLKRMELGHLVLKGEDLLDSKKNCRLLGAIVAKLESRHNGTQNILAAVRKVRHPFLIKSTLWIDIHSICSLDYWNPNQQTRISENRTLHQTVLQERKNLSLQSCLSLKKAKNYQGLLLASWHLVLLLLLSQIFWSQSLWHLHQLCLLKHTAKHLHLVMVS